MEAEPPLCSRHPGGSTPVFSCTLRGEKKEPACDTMMTPFGRRSIQIGTSAGAGALAFLLCSVCFSFLKAPEMSEFDGALSDGRWGPQEDAGACSDRGRGPRGARSRRQVVEVGHRRTMVDGSAGTCLFQRPGRRLGRQRDPPCLRHRNTRSAPRRAGQAPLLAPPEPAAWGSALPGQVRVGLTCRTPVTIKCPAEPRAPHRTTRGQREPRIHRDTGHTGPQALRARPVSQHMDLASQGGLSAPKSGNRNALRTLPVPAPPAPNGNRSHRGGLAGTTASQAQEAPSQLQHHEWEREELEEPWQFKGLFCLSLMCLFSSFFLEDKETRKQLFSLALWVVCSLAPVRTRFWWCWARHLQTGARGERDKAALRPKAIRVKGASRKRPARAVWAALLCCPPP